MTQMNETYLYRGSAKEAKRRDELPLWRESHKANIACREAIEDAYKQSLRQNQQQDNALPMEQSM